MKQIMMKVKKNVVLAVSVMAFAGITLTGCSSVGTSAKNSTSQSDGADVGKNKSGNDSEDDDSLVFATGGEQGTYYSFGNVLAEEICKSTDTSVRVIKSGGSQANVEALSTGKADLGFVQSDIMVSNYKGDNFYKVDNFSTVAALYMEPVQIVTLDPSIQSVEDLKGKNVSIGAVGSGVYYNAVDVLGSYDLDIDQDINPMYQSFKDSAQALRSGAIDAAFVVAGVPTAAITSLAEEQQMHLVGLDDAHIEQLLEICPYYSKNTIPASAYGLDEDVKTVAVGAIVVARDDVPEENVYDFCAGIFENMDEIKAAHVEGEELDLNMAASVITVPYHPGAAKYFAEKGIEVPVKE